MARYPARILPGLVGFYIPEVRTIFDGERHKAGAGDRKNTS